MDKPKRIHTSLKEALKEAQRISRKECFDDIQVLQIITTIHAKDGVPF